MVLDRYDGTHLTLNDRFRESRGAAAGPEADPQLAEMHGGKLPFDPGASGACLWKVADSGVRPHRTFAAA